ncbi:MAG: ABC transporter ATP-binding protein [Planctomycetes bacterium]|nr:ABC transporter ATP-binding protein [Planctomycetota bacterium]
MLEIKNLRKTYPGGVQALRGVSLKIENGMFGLLGPNGAGKTTLMKCVATLLEPDDGVIALNGLDVLREKEDVRRVLGYLPQDFGLYPSLTAEQMLDYLACMKGVTERSERRRLVGALLERVNLASVKKRRLGSYSGGMRQRFGIAQALLGAPKLLVVDEPTAGLDPEDRNRFQNLLAELSGEIVVLLSTHIVSDVTALCHDMAIIRDGLIVQHGTPRAAVEAMRGKVWEKVVPRALLDKYRSRLPVISANPSIDGIRLRVLSEGNPATTYSAGDGFVAVEPNLEDVYFSFVTAPEAQSSLAGSGSGSHYGH